MNPLAELLAERTPLFPCRTDKRPWCDHGFYDATCDPVTIDYWDWKYRHPNWATPVGEGQLLVDIDPRHGGDRTLIELEARRGPLPATRTTITPSGGRHLWFSVGGECRQTAGFLGPGIDTRADGRGYGMLIGAGYSWADRGPIVPAPEWLEALLRPVPIAPSSEWREVTNRADCTEWISTGATESIGNGAGLVAWVATRPEGERNHGLYAAAAQLHTEGLLDRYEQELVAAAVGAGLTCPEAERTISNARVYAA